MANSVYSAVPTDLPRLTIYLDEELKEDLKKLASSDRRSMSQMAVILIEQGINQAKREGKFPKDEGDRNE